jgi:hypothetical protein
MFKLLSTVSVVAMLAIVPASAQTTTPNTTPPSGTQDKSPSATTPSSPTQDKSSQPGATTGTQTATQDQAVTLSEEQAKQWVDKLVFGSDDKEIGEVAEFKRGPDNKVTELHADIGGFMGMGETRIKVLPSQFKLQGDRVVLTVSEAQAKELPKVDK